MNRDIWEENRKMTEIEYSQYIFQDKNIAIPLELSFLKEILNDNLLDYYDKCIVQGLNLTQYAKCAGISYGKGRHRKIKCYNTIVSDERVAREYFQLHNEFPKLMSPCRRLTVTDLDFVFSERTINMLYTQMRIKSQEELHKKILAGDVKKNACRLMGEKTYREISNWYSQYNCLL